MSQRRTAAAKLSADYHAGAGSPTTHSGWDAYALTRAPATEAAAAQALAWTAQALPDGWTPAAALDVGSGTGATAAAVSDRWPDAALVCIETDATARALGEGAVPQAEWRAGDLRVAALPPSDLVTAAYCLNELGPYDVQDAADRLWAATRGVLLVIEPGTPAGFAIVRSVRDRLIAAGATVAAPCPHDDGCPVSGDDWCHSSVRVVRSTEHRSAKVGAVGHEDEKLAYVALSRLPVDRSPARVVRHPRYATKLVTLRTCAADGALHDVKVSKSMGEPYKHARDVRWGDPW